ncbi:MAG: hypothetical protein IJT62_06325 [Oscillospiraceae bacterium]|nr:hypothetical protein [Oscillospiraceae bacterium]
MTALDKAHRRGMIHRDISPDNLMLDREGEIWLLDLGAAKDLGAGQTAGSQSTTPVMKRGFSPPEQYTSGSSIGPWTDVYALCATICWCVTGQLVPEAMERVLGKELTIPDVIPPRAAEVLLHGMALRPEERIQDIPALLAELDAAEREQPFVKRAQEKQNVKTLDRTNGTKKTGRVGKDAERRTDQGSHGGKRKKHRC